MLMGGSHARAMTSGKFCEHAALVALLRAQANELRWPEIAAEVLEVGSALEVWNRRARSGYLAVLARRATAQAHVPDAECHNVRLRASYRDG